MVSERKRVSVRSNADVVSGTEEPWIHERRCGSRIHKDADLESTRCKIDDQGAIDVIYRFEGVQGDFVFVARRIETWVPIPTIRRSRYYRSSQRSRRCSESLLSRDISEISRSFAMSGWLICIPCILSVYARYFRDLEKFRGVWVINPYTVYSLGARLGKNDEDNLPRPASKKTTIGCNNLYRYPITRRIIDDRDVSNKRRIERDIEGRRRTKKTSYRFPYEYVKRPRNGTLPNITKST